MNAEAGKRLFAGALYRKGELDATKDLKPQTIMAFPLTEQDNVLEYNLSPDGKEFAVAVDGLLPRLLFVPIKDDVTAKQVRVVELKISPSTTTAPATAPREVS